MPNPDPQKLSSEELREEFRNLFQNAAAARDDVTLATEGEFIVSLMFVNDAYKYDPNKAAIDNVFDAFLDKAELLIQSYASRCRKEELESLLPTPTQWEELLTFAGGNWVRKRIEDLEKQYRGDK